MTFPEAEPEFGYNITDDDGAGIDIDSDGDGIPDVEGKEMK